MKARTVTFWIDEHHLAEVIERFDDEVLPAFRAAPNFVGLVVLREEASRRLIGLSVWDGDQPGCEEQMAEFRSKIAELSGLTPSMSTFDVLRLVASQDV